LSAQAAKQSQFGVVLAIDASQSMKGKPIAAAMAAARAFAAQRNPNQQLGVIVFNGKVHIVQPLTASAAEIKSALSKAPHLAYGTRIYDALNAAAKQLAAAHVQGASIVLLSDGADVGSKAKPSAVLNNLAANHIRTFTVGLDSAAFKPKSLEHVAVSTN